MYRVFCDGELLYHPNLSKLKIFSAKLQLELNKTGNFTFIIYPDHPLYNKLYKLKSTITVYNKNGLIFRGRILNEKDGFYNEKQVVCEGELAFLVDSIQRPFNTKSISIADLFSKLINTHNSQVGENRQFKIGKVTVSPETIIAITDNFKDYPTTWDAINNILIKNYNGYLWVRHESDENYIDYISDFDDNAVQPIEFGKNLTDVLKNISGEDVATALIPLGKESDSGSKAKLTISSVNGGVDYIYDEEAVSEFGWIFKPVNYTDITKASELLSKAKEDFKTYINLSSSIELGAVDLSSINKDFDSFSLGLYVNVLSNPHNIKSKFLVNKLTIDLLNPTSNKLTIGSTCATLTEQTNNMGSIIKNGVIKVETGEITIENKQTIILLNSWENYSADYEPASYWKDISNTVRISGMIKNGNVAIGTRLFTLPAGYRPSKTERFSLMTYDNVSCTVDIYYNGDALIVANVYSDWLSLSGISFKTE